MLAFSFSQLLRAFPDLGTAVNLKGMSYYDALLA